MRWNRQGDVLYLLTPIHVVRRIFVKNHLQSLEQRPIAGSIQQIRGLSFGLEEAIQSFIPALQCFRNEFKSSFAAEILFISREEEILGWFPRMDFLLHMVKEAFYLLRHC